MWALMPLDYCRTNLLLMIAFHMCEILISFLVLKTLQQLHPSFTLINMVVSLSLNPVFLVPFHSAVSEREYTLASSERIGTVTFPVQKILSIWPEVWGFS